MENVISCLGAGVIIENGSISTTDDFAVLGRVCTKLISTANVVVGPSAYFEGTIIAHNLEIKGTFKGTAYVKENMLIRSGSKVMGTIRAFSLSIESGASFNGSSETISEEFFKNNVGSNKIYHKLADRVSKVLTEGVK